jgi:hypothetical protein
VGGRRPNNRLGMGRSLRPTQASRTQIRAVLPVSIHGKLSPEMSLLIANAAGEKLRRRPSSMASLHFLAGSMDTVTSSIS